MTRTVSHTICVALVAVLCASLSLAGAEAEAQTRRVDLQILIVSAGDVGTATAKAALDEALVPYFELDLTRAGRPLVDDAFLADSPAGGLRRAKFQAVVLPSEAPPALSAAERAALVRFQREFKIRQFDAYVYPSPAVGMNWPANPGYLGPFDGLTASVTAAARAADFGYLNGAVPFEDLAPGVSESYGYLATPLAADPVQRRSFTPLVELAIPGSSANGVVLGVFQDDGREELILTVAMNQVQLQQQLLFPGILEWLTYGVHFGASRNYLAVHIDDIFLGDARWSTAFNCTVGDGCPANVDAPDIVMTAADVDYMLAWQARQNLKLDLAFNGFGYDQAIALEGSSPLGARLLSARGSLRWINHTYTHFYLGCVQDFAVVPWRCATDASGAVRWTPYADVAYELRENLSFAARVGIPLDATELVTGEHSGLRRAPEEPGDNPFLEQALSQLGVRWLASDNSRESEQRALGSARTVPRYPMNIFYNVATEAEEVDEYNWIYNARADGGSGLCEQNPTSTCIRPLDPAGGFGGYIVPLEARIALLHVLANSPRPHYAHQSNLAEQRILYRVLDRLLDDYRSLFAPSAPLVNPTLAQAGAELSERASWAAARAQVAGYVEGGAAVLQTSAGASVRAPLTVPSGSAGGSLGAYAGSLSGWQTVAPALATRISLSSRVGYAR